VERLDTQTDKEAAENLGISAETVKHWRQKPIIDDALKLAACDGAVTAIHMRRRNLAKAMAVKVALLDADDPRIRDKASTDIIEWELGKATQPERLEGEVTVRRKAYIGFSPEEWDDVAGEEA
jgi:hypothetical protein